MENKNLKVKSNTNVLAYTGDLKITLNHGSRTYKVIEHHNTGTAEFFRFMLNCIRGVVAPLERPYLLYLYKDKDCQQLTTRIAFQLTSDSEPTMYKNSEGLGDDYAQTSFTTFIADNYIAGKEFAGVKITTMAGVEYARISLDEPIHIEGSDTNIAIDWVITLGNKGVYAEV